MDPHPDFPAPENHVEPCPVCGETPDFTGMPLGHYGYVGMPDGSCVLQLAQPADPNIIPYLQPMPILAHVCGPLLERMNEVKARQESPLVVAQAEEMTRLAAAHRPPR